MNRMQVNGLDAVNDAFIQTGVVPGFCETTYVSWGAAQVTILKPGKSFLWEGNENFVPEDPNPAAPPRGRQVRPHTQYYHCSQEFNEQCCIKETMQHACIAHVRTCLGSER